MSILEIILTFTTVFFAVMAGWIWHHADKISKHNKQMIQNIILNENLVDSAFSTLSMAYSVDEDVVRQVLKEVQLCLEEARNRDWAKWKEEHGVDKDWNGGY